MLVYKCLYCLYIKTAKNLACIASKSSSLSSSKVNVSGRDTDQIKHVYDDSTFVHVAIRTRNRQNRPKVD